MVFICNRAVTICATLYPFLKLFILSFNKYLNEHILLLSDTVQALGGRVVNPTETVPASMSLYYSGHSALGGENSLCP